jgi:hypothetical protein
MHLKWGHRRAQTGDENLFAGKSHCRFGAAFGFKLVELAKGFEPPTL